MLPGMTDTRVVIAAPIAAAADLTALAGLPLALRDGRIRYGPDIVIEEDLVRRLADMRDVVADKVGRRGRRIEYHMLNGVRQRNDTHLADLPLRYELTALAGHAIGWEAAKTLGHVHVCPPGGSTGYPEVVEVLHGEAGFLIQDLADGLKGPRARRAWLVRARPGDQVVLPPDLAHVTIDLGAGPLVFSDVIDRRARGIYSGVAASHGFGWYVGADGGLRPNPRFAQPPHLEEVTAADWSEPAPSPLYRHFAADPGQLAWLSDPTVFPQVAPGLAARIGDALG
jgi:oxalate decarboxylase/phosphoglucose isomerase-like protein (cupin superfamily)